MIGDAERRASSEGRTITGYRPFSYQYGGGRGGVKTASFQVPLFSMTEEERLGPLRAEQRRLSEAQTKLFEEQKYGIAEQLKILQSEKSSLAKAQESYSNMLIQEANRRKEAEEKARLEAQSLKINQGMANRSGVLQIRPASSTPRTAGTEGFKRRAQQFGTAYKGLSKIQSGMVNA
tara:strand:- start:65 stop:595 length:531 start_codon:yes stop_codon:yes gene_type:complete